MLGLMPLVAIQGPGNTTPMDVAGAGLLLLYWRSLLARGERLPFPLALPVWLILVGSLVGTFAAVERGRAFLMLGKDVYLYLLFGGAAHFVARRCRVEQVVAIWTAIACALVALTLADLHLGLAGGRFGLPQRAIGTFENPNMFGSYLVISLFLAWAAASAGRRAYYLAMIVLLAGIDATASNGAAMSTAAGCLAVAAAQPIRRLLPRLGAVLVVAAIGLAVVVPWHEHLREGSLDVLQSRDRGAIGGDALKGAGERFPIWLDAVASIRRNPTGVGPGNFNRLGGEVSRGYHGAHNDYLGMLTERGPLGLVGWLAVLGGIGAAVTRVRRAPAASRPLAPAPLYGLLAAVTLHATVLELSHFRHFWLVLAVVFAAAAQADLRATAAAVVVEPAMREAA
jgi:O-antigen ligase